MYTNAFIHWGLDLASQILDICQEGKAKEIVDAINDWPKGMLDGEKRVSCRFLSGVLTGFLCFSCLPACAPGINRL